jgi:hypothetical protein
MITMDDAAIVIPCDHTGTPNAGILPARTRARLFRGSTEVTAASEAAAIRARNVVRYPSTGSGLFTPMFPGWYPVRTYPVDWSLSGAPAGVTVDAAGFIDIAAGAALGDNTTITVTAVYNGESHGVKLAITKTRDGVPGIPGVDGKPGKDGETGPQGTRSARYLGTTATIPTGNRIVIVKGEKTGQVEAVAGDYALMTAAGLAWTRGMLRQWDGAAWTKLDVAGHVGEYMAASLDLMDMADLQSQTNSFPAVFARLLFAMFLKIGAAVYGGERFDREGTVVDATKPGFYLGSDGILKAVDGEFSGTVNATSGVFDNVDIGNKAMFRGDILSGPIVALNATTGTTTTHFFPAQTSLSSIATTLGFSYPDGVGTSSLNVSNGSYTGKNGVVQVSIFHFYSPSGYFGPEKNIWNMSIYFSDGSAVLVEDQIAAPLTLYPSLAGKILKLIGLPSGGEASYETNSVYEKDGYLMIKK